MDWIKRYRQFRGKQREQLAREVGISPESLARYERGDRIPTADVLKKIADALGVTTDQLLGNN